MSIGELNFLVAEDHEFQRNALVWMLNGLGARAIRQAHDGRSALRIVADANLRGTITKERVHDQPGTTAMSRSPQGSKSRSSSPPAIRAPDSRSALSPQCHARTRAGDEPSVWISY